MNFPNFFQTSYHGLFLPPFNQYARGNHQERQEREEREPDLNRIWNFDPPPNFPVTSITTQDNFEINF